MKKLIIVCTIMVMVLAMAMPCFASEIKYPLVPSEHEHVIVWVSSDGVLRAYAFSEYVNQKDTSFVDCYNVDVFNYDGKAWVYAQTNETSRLGNSQEVWFDSTGVLKIDKPMTFKGPIGHEDWEELYNKFTEQITIKNIVAVLVLGASAVVGIVFMWWGVRKLTRAVFSAFRKGKISV